MDESAFAVAHESMLLWPSLSSSSPSISLPSVKLKNQLSIRLFFLLQNIQLPVDVVLSDAAGEFNDFRT